MCIWQSIWHYIINPPAWLQTVEVLLAVIGLGYLINWPIRKVWPTRERWLAEFKHGDTTLRTPDLQDTLKKDRRLSWTSPEPQAEGDRYKIDFGKPRGREICEVEFYERNPTNEIPYEWTLQLVNDWGVPVRKPFRYTGKRIFIRFEPIRIHGIEVIINRPMTEVDGIPYHWRIENVYFREAKLFGRWLRWRI